VQPQDRARYGQFRETWVGVQMLKGWGLVAL